MQSSDFTPDRSEKHEDRHFSKTLMWIGIGLGVAGLGAGVAYAIVRTVLGGKHSPDDPTSQRIQQLIDEANSLLKTLDEQRNSA